MKADGWQCLQLSSWSTEDQPFHAPERYLLDLTTRKNISLSPNTGSASVELQHNKGHNNSKVFSMIIKVYTCILMNLINT